MIIYMGVKIILLIQVVPIGVITTLVPERQLYKFFVFIYNL
jgi:hypothetical protein